MVIEEREHYISVKKSNNKKKVFIILLIILLLIGIGVVYFFIRTPKDSETDYWFDEEAINGILHGDENDIQGALNQVVEKGMFNVAISPNPVFERGDKEGKINIENIPANHYYCQVTIENSSGNIMYKSGGIKPGQYIEKIKLKKKLAKGNYPATAIFEITDPENLHSIGEVRVELVISVLS